MAGFKKVASEPCLPIATAFFCSMLDEYVDDNPEGIYVVKSLASLLSL